MNDRELADAVVALGVGMKRKLKAGNHEWFLYSWDKGNKDFVRDWRVVGALMEKCRHIHIYWDDIDYSVVAHGPTVTGKTTGKGEVDALDKNFYPLPRAIIEACVEALQLSG